MKAVEAKKIILALGKKKKISENSQEVWSESLRRRSHFYFTLTVYMDFGQLEYNEKEGEPDQTVSFLFEIVFTASRPRDFYTENISSILMT